MIKTVLDKVIKAAVQDSAEFENPKVFRNEFKYFLDPYKYKVCRDICERYMDRDKYADENGDYRLTSVYFDSINDGDYFDKEFGSFERKKIRIRRYGDEQGWTHLEAKRKIGILGLKDKVRLDREQTLSVLSCDYSPLLDIGSKNSVNFYAIMQGRLYRPVSTIKYLRTPYLLPFEDIRITFDQEVSYSNSNFDIFEDMVTNPVFPVGHVVLEIKYNEMLPGWIKRMMKHVLLTNEALSKYGLAREYYI